MRTEARAAGERPAGAPRTRLWAQVVAAAKRWLFTEIGLLTNMFEKKMLRRTVYSNSAKYAGFSRVRNTSLGLSTRGVRKAITLPTYWQLAGRLAITGRRRDLLQSESSFLYSNVQWPCPQRQKPIETGRCANATLGPRLDLSGA
jgi:hypothetical protein